MKLIIDIPEDIYEALRKASLIISGQRSGKNLTSIIFDAVTNGIPISSSEYEKILQKYVTKVINRGNCMMCGKELTEGIFFCKECDAIIEADKEGAE